MQQHGGNVWEAAARYGVDPAHCLDFSASINPLGLPAAARQAVVDWLPLATRYPDPQCRELVRALSRHLGLDGEHLVCGNGATELIFLAARVLRPGRVALPVPTFGEYARAVCAAGGAVLPVPLDEERGFFAPLPSLLEQSEGIDAVVVCNPNNPTGRVWPREEVLELTSRAASRDIMVVVDEAFVDFVDAPHEVEVASQVARHPNLLVLRSLTKFYALAGLRVGYAVAGVETAQRLRQAQEPWTVNVLAQAAAVAALGDGEYRRQTERWLREQREFMVGELKRRPALVVWDTAANFVLVKLRDERWTAASLQEALAPRGILIRDCSSFAGLGPRFVRLAILGREQNQRLLAALDEVLA
ncbi:MAG: threonine-phosphate decarboxylase CobD [Syntrophomonadaceae bacterium]|jgi:threonine-phosphate decarboxylase|nr:threonine-phosphate decarboxylase CobD [Syntrophomonadaceae bacterium]MDH7497717.1 threonine-phosphate decarboxylase CobD [Syntrophomonadaceae bacterium]